MPANDEFPRGWVRASAGASNVANSIIIPAVVGITHVLTDVRAVMLNRSGAPASANVNVNGNFLFTMDLLAATNIDGESWSGKISSPIGLTLTVAFSAGGVNVFEYLTIQGYDV